MPGLITESTGARLRQLLAQGRTTQQGRSRLPVTGRRPMLVKCTSATAIGGANPIGAECYPAVVVSAVNDQLVSAQTELGAVWLTVVSGGASIVPTVGEWYDGLLSGTFDPDPTGTSDERPRVFATPVGSGASLSAGTTLGGTGILASITSDATWTNSGVSVSLPSSGTYLLIGQMGAEGKVSANQASPGAWISARLYDSTSVAAVPSTEVAALQAYTNGLLMVGAATMAAVYTCGANTIRIEAYRSTPGTPGWSTSDIIGSTGESGTRLSYVKLF